MMNYIQVLHLYDNFGTFNININNFIGKNSLKNNEILKLYFPYDIQDLGELNLNGVEF